jgi:hypothetical protein
MKAMQVGLLVAIGALGGMLLMKWQNQRTAAPAAAPQAPVAPQAPPSQPPAPPAAAVEPPKPSPMAAKAPRKPPAPKEPVRVAEATPPVKPAEPPPAVKPPDPAPQKPAEPPASPAKQETPAPPPPAPRQVTVAAGTLLQTRINESLSSEHNMTGDGFTASLDQPLVIDGLVIAEKGARLEGKVVQSDKGGRVKGVSAIAIELTRLMTSDGQRVDLQTEVFQKTANATTGKDAAKVGAAAGIGAIIGAIAGGGKGAAIGAAAGGAGGVGGVLATRGDAATIASETRLTFRLRADITLTEKR